MIGTSGDQVNFDNTHTSSVKRSEFVRHVFSLPSRSGTHETWKSTLRVTKPSHRTNPQSSLKQLGPRARIHRALTSWFSNSPLRSTYTGNHGTHSSVSSNQSSSFAGSVDLVAPRAFLFSGPSLQSSNNTYGSTANLPTPREPSSRQRSLRLVHTDSFSVIENIDDPEGFLEPSNEKDIMRSLSHVLLNNVTIPAQSMDERQHSIFRMYCGHSPSSFNQAYKQLPLDAPLMSLLAPYLDFASWKSLRMTCRQWHAIVNLVSPPTFPPSYRIPFEILQQIYENLHPKDFNAARHTCRSWMRASLHKKLLIIMLSRGGWLRDKASYLGNLADSEWALSRLLARECALSARWSGNGLDKEPAITEIAQTDFSKLDCSDTDTKRDNRQISGLVFTASACGQFTLIARGNLIHLYDMQDGSLELISSILCPRRVLSMSIDVSSSRKAVATLLEGRMGTLSELQDNYDIGNKTQMPFEAVQIKASSRSYSLERAHDPRMHDRNFINPTWNLELRGRLCNHKTASTELPFSKPTILEWGPITLYRHLCSQEDPPRSVSICPQRRCVAFGCASGIELHWIDAITGTSLSRWFPLTAPSDYLHFLVPRPGLESANKLRLISSPAHPNDHPEVSRRYVFNRFGSIPVWQFTYPDTYPPNRRSAHSDHYHAVPLSDGHHVLFVDLTSSRLYLGCDASRTGPTRLLRKVLFIPPVHVGEQVPHIYATGADLSYGARVVVAFGDTIMLYSVPRGICDDSRIDKSDALSAARLPEDHWSHWWNEESPVNDGIEVNAVWPVAISGTEVGTLPDVCELAVQTNPDIEIWGFSRSSQGKTWRLRNYVDPMARSRRYVGQDGQVRQAYDVDAAGDVMMADAPPFLASLGDGMRRDEETSDALVNGDPQWTYVRFPKGLAVENDDGVDFLDVTGFKDAWFEGDGDVVAVRGT